MFYTNFLPSRVSNQVAKFPAFLGRLFYLVLTVSGESRHGWVVEVEGGQDVRRKAWGCIRTSYGHSDL